VHALFFSHNEIWHQKVHMITVQSQLMSLKQTTHTNNLQGIEEKTEHGQHTRFNVVRFP